MNIAGNVRISVVWEEIIELEMSMLKKNMTFLLVLSFGVFFSVSTFAKETITWMEVDFAPFLIHSGPFKGGGYGDVGSDILVENLPQYDHSVILANLSRQYELYQQQENVCTVGLFKNPDREKFMYFSIPVFFSLPNHLIISKDKHDEIGGLSSVQLKDVLQSNKIVIGHSKNRSYSAEIDSVLKEYGSSKNLFLAENRGAFTTSFFEMLKLGRVDAIIAAPEEILYQAEQLGLRDKLVTVSIEENSLDAWLSYVVCAKTPWGKKVITDINEVLIKQRPTDRYREAYERWLDEGRLKEYRRLYISEFLSVKE